MTGNMMEFTDQNFESEVLGADKPTLVDFWAEWCGPCKQIAPTVEALADEFEGKIRVGKLNIDENPSTPTKFGIRGIPTLIIFKGGEPVDQVVGVRSKADLKAAIEKSL
jgi:thioredoxin 1